MYNVEQEILKNNKTNESDKTIVELYTNGDSIIKIAKAIHKPVEGIKQILIDNGVTLDH